MSTTRSRTIQVNQLVFSQADFFMPDGYTRVQGLGIADVVGALYFNNTLQPWTVTSGLNVPDPLAVSGKVYFNEVPGSPGIYNIRFRPNAVGYWRFLLQYPVGLQTVIQEYDIVPAIQVVPAGITSSFVDNCDHHHEGYQCHE